MDAALHENDADKVLVVKWQGGIRSNGYKIDEVRINKKNTCMNWLTKVKWMSGTDILDILRSQASKLFRARGR